MPVEAVKCEIALDMLKDCLGESGKVIISRHFREELAKEGLTLQDAWTVLRSGNIPNPPECDIKTGEWKYRIEGLTADAVRLAVVFSFKYVNQACLITVFSI
jgi:hypothetical protein